jgi:exonuclease SbcD
MSKQQLSTPAIDYLALGHLHVPQLIGQAATRRYSGSPIPMGYGEARQQKIVLLAEFTGREATVRERPVPCFQKLERIQARSRPSSTGSLPCAARRAPPGSRSNTPARRPSPICVNRSTLPCRTAGWNATDPQPAGHSSALSGISASDHLDELDPAEVFARCLDAGQIPDSERPELVAAYTEILSPSRKPTVWPSDPRMRRSLTA